MNWSFTLVGQPPSLNDLYTIGWRSDRRGRRYKGIVKSEDAQLYHDGAVPQIRVAKPSRWAPTGFVRLRIRLFLASDIDADNTLKVLSDAIQSATGINDKVFLPCIESKVIGLSRAQARVEVVVEEVEPLSPPLPPAAPGWPSPVPASSPPPQPAQPSRSSSISAARRP